MEFVVLGVGIAFIVVSIAWFKLNAFLALILAAILVGLLSPKPLSDGKEAPGRPAKSQAVLALELATTEFGATAGSIGVVIALAAVIGQCLMESGAADKITRRFLAVLGERRAGVALLASGYFLSIPVFFDTVFYLLVPLARALRARTGRDYVLYVMAICAGGVVTHSIVPPTPGPLAMVENLNLNLGTAIGLGFLIGLPVSVAGGIWYSGFMNRRLAIPLRDAPGSSRQELEALARKPESELPGFFVSILPVVLPVVLITGDAVLKALAAQGTIDPAAPGTRRILDTSGFLGDRTFSLLLATGIASWVLLRQNRLTLAQLRDKLEPALLSAGLIILITSAGGAFGKMLARTGIGDALRDASGAAAGGGLKFIFLAWGIAVVMKLAQGSGTVSMLTSSAIMASIVGTGGDLPYHRVYVYSAVAFGSLGVSWMNDSGFWVVCKLSGFTEAETLRTWTGLLFFLACLGLLEVIVLCQAFPLK